MHRVRISLPFYREFGWEPTVLCIHPDCTDHPLDPMLSETVPANIDVHRIRCISASWTRPIGLGAVSFRGYFAMRRACLRMVANITTDLAFFSTTSFPLMALGPALKKRFQLPYVLDFQDPWINPTGSIHRATLKNRLVEKIHQALEPSTVQNASGLIAVSPNYLNVLTQRYPAVSRLPKAVIPFGTPSADIDLARTHSGEPLNGCPLELEQDLTTKTVGVYAGAYVSSMQPMVEQFFAAIRTAVQQLPRLASQLSIWFIGSNYSAGSHETPIADLARTFGLSSIVREVPQRVPYFTAIRLAIRSHFSILFGSTNAAYNPSKLFMLLSTGAPILAFVQSGTAAADTLQQAGGTLISYVNDQSAPCENSVLIDYLKNPRLGSQMIPSINRDFVDRFSAKETTRSQVELFDLAIAHTHGND